jgi:uncharacterized membrane protein YobD (UPF0266 family)
MRRNNLAFHLQFFKYGAINAFTLSEDSVLYGHKPIENLRKMIRVVPVQTAVLS